VNFAAPLHVTVLVRAIDSGPVVDRVWRMSCEIGPAGVRVRRDLPFEPGRPVRVEMSLPDEDQLLAVTGVVREIAPRPGELEELREAGEDPARPRPRAIEFVDVDANARGALLRYVEERNMES
jgi:hypothetical protein